MNVLMIAFEFPPLGGIGVQRSLKLAKYLPEHGVRPIVITPDQASLERVIGSAREEALLQELPGTVQVERVPCPALPPPAKTKAGRWLRGFFRIGEELGAIWREAVMVALPDIIRRERPTAVYVSVPPFSMAPLALEVAERWQLPLVVDFRDHWSLWGSDPHPSVVHHRLVDRLEGRVLRGAAAVTSVTSQLIRDLRAAHPEVPERKFGVVPNGFDGAAALAETIPVRAGTRERPFVIGYVGSFYYTPQSRASILEPWWQRSPARWLHYSPRREDWLYRSPFFCFRALAQLFSRRPELRERVRVRFVGDTPDWLREQVRAAGLEDVVEHLGRMPHRACLEFQSSCDALLVTSTKVLGGEDYCIAGKTFEYVAAQRPVVGFVTPGAQRWFLENSGVALVADPDDPATASARLEDLVEGRLKFRPDSDFLRQFHRRETAGLMANTLRRITRQPAPTSNPAVVTTVAGAEV